MSQVVVDRNGSGAKTAGKAMNILLWVLQIGAAAMFLMAGSLKLAGGEQVVGMFNVIGLGQWFRYLTGALEITGAVMLLIPRLSGVGALLLICVMIGAVITHLFVIGGSPVGAIVLLVVSVIIAWGRRDRTLRLLGR
jgi:putative oxidoreductase